MRPLGWKVPNMLLRKSGGQLLIAAERMKWLGQRRHDAQLWMCLVIKIKPDSVKKKKKQQQYFIGIWNVRSMNQDKLGVVKQKWKD